VPIKVAYLDFFPELQMHIYKAKYEQDQNQIRILQRDLRDFVCTLKSRKVRRC